MRQHTPGPWNCYIGKCSCILKHKEICDLTKAELKLLQIMKGPPLLSITRTWQGFSKSGYLRCRVGEKVFNRSMVDSLYKRGYLFSLKDKADVTRFSSYGITNKAYAAIARAEGKEVTR